MSTSQTTIVDFTDYRDFLRTRFELEKTRNPRVSYQYCAHRIGTTKSYLKHVFDKRNHISLEKVSRIGELFKLSALEREYLVFMVLQGTTREPVMRSYFGGLLEGLKKQLGLAMTEAPQTEPSA